MKIKIKHFSFISIGLFIFALNSINWNIYDVSAANQWTSIYDCVKDAYEAGGSSLEAHSVTETANGGVSSSAVDSIVSACRSCKGSDNQWQGGGYTQSATWFSSDNSTDGAYNDGASYIGVKKNTIDIYLFTAGNSCAMTPQNSAGMDKSFINIQDGVNSSTSACPLGTSYVAANGQTWHNASTRQILLPNCNNDGWKIEDKKSVASAVTVSGNITSFSLNPDYGSGSGYIPADTGNVNRTSVNYFKNLPTYGLGTWLTTSGLGKEPYVWAGVGNPISLKLDVEDFINYVTEQKAAGNTSVDIDIDENHDPAHYVRFIANNVYVFGCIKDSYPGMVSGTWQASCSTRQTKLVLTYIRPKLIIKAVDENGNSMEDTFSDVGPIYGSLGTDEVLKDVTGSARTNTQYSLLGFRAEPTGTYLSNGNKVNEQTIKSIDKNKITIESMANHVTVYAVYKMNSFKGRAAVVEGNSFSANNGKPRISTGFVNTNKTADGSPLEIECENTGCDVRFMLSIKKTGGGGTSSFTAQKKLNNGSWGNIPADENLKSSPSYGTDGDEDHHNVFLQTKKIYPGQTLCYRLTFHTWGSGGENATATVTACAKAIATTFMGMSRIAEVSSNTTTLNYDSINNSKKKTTDFVQYNKEVTHVINNCSPSCSVGFEHYLKRIDGTKGSIDYEVTKTSTIEGNGTIKTSTENFTTNNPNEVSESIYKNISPGMLGFRICESLSFKPSNNAARTIKNATTTACAVVTNNVIPTDFIKMEVINTSVDKYNSYQKEVYAKPGDQVNFRATYEPTVQSAYGVTIDGQVKIKNTECPSSTEPKTWRKTLGTAFNDCYDGPDWNNGFRISGTYDNYDVYNDGPTVGDPSKVVETTDTRSVSSSDVGKTNYFGKALTNANSGDKKTAPFSVSSSIKSYQVAVERTGAEDDFSSNTIPTTETKNVVVYDVDIDSKDDTAYIRVPYNFITSTEITSKDKTNSEDGDTAIYAGEEISIKYNVNVKPRKNDLTTNSENEKYATKAPTRRRIIVYNPNAGGTIKEGTRSYGNSKDDNLCQYFGFSNGANNEICGYAKVNTNANASDSTIIDSTLNSNSNKDGQSNNYSATFFIQDLTAGSRICIASAIYPSNSGGKDNYSDSEGNHHWAISDSECFDVAKRPSLQVWGGNIYSAGSITTGISKKKNLLGSTSNDSYHIFGSWGELGIIASGRITGLVSGASTGYALNNNGTLTPRHSFGNVNGSDGNNGLVSEPGGASEKKIDYCLRSPLSFANDKCSNGSVGNLTDSNAIKGNVNDDKANIIDNLNSKDPITPTNPLTLTKIDDTTKDAYYKDDNMNLVVSGTAELTTGTHVVEAKNIMISGNLTYSGTYSTLEDMPKIIIYAKENIYINCNVERIDALLVANTIVTCGNSFDMSLSESEIGKNINNPENSVQLAINGAIIANKLIANRTYGAATGANSIISAEIINFDNTLYLWGNKKSEKNMSLKLVSAYSRELSPRL
ncbi:hypothetical protein IKG33_01515 [Candidatus Saccharibacteria bacterium]|nr:hypothetical protein [Candidatus Saccharibacteria bacterium]